MKVMSNSGSIFISAGDPSADYPGKLLIDEITRACPKIEILGLGGPKMQDAGLSAMVAHKELAVLGFWEIVPKFFFFRRLLKQAVQIIEEKRPAAVILLDYPGFNLRLASRIKHLKIPVIYYISPQVWAWGKGRVKTIREVVDLMMVIFPFEEEFYSRHNINARFTGHPVVDRYRSMPDRETCRAKVIKTSDKKLIGLLPGSRLQEIKRMLPVMVEAADLIRRDMPETEFIVAAADGIDEDLIRRLIGRSQIGIRRGLTPEIIGGADLVITSSGTATIETAYFGTPMVVIYKTGELTYQIARRLIKLDAIGMVNIVAGDKIVPELIQHEANASSIAKETIDLLQDHERYEQMKSELFKVREKLGDGEAGRRAFEAITELVKLC